MAIFEEASPICRGKNLSWETIMLFFNSMPKQAMPKADFNSYVESKINAWTQTHSQIARQLAFYYEENGICYPRFTQKTDLRELFEYMKNWAVKYFIPNPYAPSLKGNTPTCIYSYIAKSLNEGRTDFDEILDSIFQVKLSSHDKVNVFLTNFTDLLIDSNHQVSFNKGLHHIDNIEAGLHPEAKFAVDAKLYFEYFSISNKKDQNCSLPPLDQPLQQIFYGAPGTGKSHTINRETKGRMTFRTTFHPDSDYSTFVGAYKPTMVSEIRYGLNGTNAVPYRVGGKDLMENRIEYRFVKQAFMKAYIAAWREFADATLVSPIQTAGVTLTNRSGYDSWILNEANSKGVNYTKVSKIDVGRYETLVKNYWKVWADADDPETFSPGRSDNYPATACVWYKKNHDPHVETSAEDFWAAVKEYLGQGNSIEENPKDQLYRVTLDGEEIRIYSTSNASLSKIEEWYNNGANGTKDNVQKNIAIKMLGYGLPSFEEAWEKLKGEIDGASQTLAPTQTESVNTMAPVFLIIEEINRGNCAQIFGDLFQLLDRKEGFSQYPIHADEDVRKCLVSEHTDEDPSFGIDGLDFSDEQRSYINSVLDCEDDVAAKIARGEVLVLPPNLYIWATMNTSDQSLFPIDSAFKRRWEWKYVKIKDHPEEEYQIKLSDTDKRDWWKFVKQVNRIIASMTSSADKQLGYFFCKADAEGVISADKFVSKVLFYLWNDVFKDYGFEDASLFRYADAIDPTKTHELTFPDFYDEEGEKVNIERVADFIDKVMAWDDNQKQG